MIELVVLNYLRSKGFRAFMEIPENLPSYPFVTIEKTGSSKRDMIETSTFAIQSYGETMYDAAVLNSQIKKSMEKAVEVDDITKVTINSDYNYTDTDTKRYRYQAVFDITHY